MGTRSWGDLGPCAVGLSFLSSAAASSGVYLLSTVSEQLTFSLINSRLVVIQEYVLSQTQYVRELKRAARDGGESQDGVVNKCDFAPGNCVFRSTSVFRMKL